jgi:hypothetical protein
MKVLPETGDRRALRAVPTSLVLAPAGRVSTGLYLAQRTSDRLNNLPPASTTAELRSRRDERSVGRASGVVNDTQQTLQAEHAWRPYDDLKDICIDGLSERVEDCAGDVISASKQRPRCPLQVCR